VDAVDDPKGNITALSNHVLVLDDEPAMRRLLRTILLTQGYKVTEAHNGTAASEAIATYETIDLLILDLGLPEMNGLDIIKEIRASGSVLPILVLSNRTDENTKVAALDLGADDYVTKPFGARELLARVRAALRHRLQVAGEKPVFKVGELSVDYIKRIVTLAGQEIKLTPKEYSLLNLLVSNAGKVLTHKFILERLWSGEADTQYVRIYIRSLRQKLESADGPPLIITEQGVGYRFVDPNEKTQET
jgi:two-component system KDP operon response regulator KdpE